MPLPPTSWRVAIIAALSAGVILRVGLFIRDRHRGAAPPEAVAAELRRRRKRGPADSAMPRAVSSWTAELMAHKAAGRPLPSGRTVPPRMHAAFLADVAALLRADTNSLIPSRHRRVPANTAAAASSASSAASSSATASATASAAASATASAALPSSLSSRSPLSPLSPPPALRVMTFNVHFYRAGYSKYVTDWSAGKIVSLVGDLSPDVLLLQEVIPDGPGSFLSPNSAGNPSLPNPIDGDASSLTPVLDELARKLGYVHRSVAAAPDAHVIPDDTEQYGGAAGRRLHVAILSRLPLRDTAAVPLVTGFAAHATIALRGKAGDGEEEEKQRTERLGDQEEVLVSLYSTHLSVRCPPDTRRREVARIMEHADATASATRTGPVASVIIGGDFNQASEADYPAEEWAVIEADMRGAGLPPDDGVSTDLRAAGYAHSFEEARVPRPGFSAWNGALVDHVWHRRGRGERGRGERGGGEGEEERAALRCGLSGVGSSRRTRRIICRCSWIMDGTTTNEAHS